MGQSPFTIVDSGNKKTFTTGMVRNSNADKVRFNQLLHGPMLKRWAEHTWKGQKIYPDVATGVPNWTLAETAEELHRAEESLLSHVLDYLNGDRVEDHAAAIMFNVNLAENIRDKMAAKRKFDEANASMRRLPGTRAADLKPEHYWTGSDNGR